MARIEVGNWFGNVRSHPAVVVDAETVEEIVAILRDRERYPNPVRAVGSNFSVTPCGAADGGTLIVMRRMERVEVGSDTVTAQAGARYVDVARELRQHQLQFFVNGGLGNLTVGSAACGASFDASMPGELAGASAYASSIELITPAGELVEITEAQADAMRAARSSHGLLGIVQAATFKVRALAPLRVSHRLLALEEFVNALPALRETGDGMSVFVDPLGSAVLVELRRYGEATAGRGPADAPWPMWNAIWSRTAPGLAHLVARYVPARPAARFLNGLEGQLVMRSTSLLNGDRSAAPARQVRYPDVAGGAGHTFSTWAFPEDRFVECLRRYVELCAKHDRDHAYAPDLPAACHFVAADQSALFSCSYAGPVVTISPTATGGPGWEDFLGALNELAVELGGTPLFEQTGRLGRAHVEKAFGDRAAQFEALRRRSDPDDRMLNAYFRDLLAQEAPASVTPAGPLRLAPE
jgi:FAD/FMN-containing dehydrogenase